MKQVIKSKSILPGQYSETVAPKEYKGEGEVKLRNEGVEYNLPEDIKDAVMQVEQSDIIWPEKFLIRLLLENGLRVSEIANPENIFEVDRERVAVYANKQKEYKIVKTPIRWQGLINGRILETIRGWKRSRQYYYRILDKYITIRTSRRKKNEPVCHAARNRIAQEIIKNGGSVEDVKKALCIKSDNAAMRYITEEQYNKIKNGSTE